MAERVIRTLKEMADAVREKTGNTEKIKGKDLPEAIRNISAAGLTPYGIYYDTLDSNGNLTKMTFFGEQLPAVYYIPANCPVIEFNETVKKIPQNFIQSNATVTEIKLTDNVEEIGPSAFTNASKLKTFTLQDGTVNRLPAAMTVVSERSFNNVPSLSPGLTWHDNIKIIGKAAFCRTNIAKVQLPANLEEIGDWPFQDATYPVTELFIPASVKKMGQQLFLNNKTILTITFRGTPDSIASTAFQGITNLKTVNVPWAEGAVAGAPWSAGNATINYNYTGG